MSEVNHNPDVLTCLANLSNDEVFTPPEVANAVLDMLPAELWSNPNTKILDPATKSGIFLREAAKRLINGLADKIPDLQERIDHIMQKQLYGYSITELTAHLSRRSLYCSKTANGPYSITTFKTDHGNVLYRRVEHKWEGDKCTYCGASKGVLDRGDDMETHAYQFIHMNSKTQKELTDMKFDLIISNPPYQLSDGGNSASESPIYHKFVEQAKKLKPRYLCMITPSRWFNGGKGLDEFRSNMMNDNHIRTIVDYQNAKECFPGVSIGGGVSYFLWSRDEDGDCNIINVSGNNKNSMIRSLSAYPVFVRSNEAVRIIEKIRSISPNSISRLIGTRNPFGLETKIRGNKNKSEGDLTLLSSAGTGYIRKNEISKNGALVSQYKTLISRVCSEHAGEPDKDGMYKVLATVKTIGPGVACTDSYIICNPTNNKNEAENFTAYLQSKFVRFLIIIVLSSINITSKTMSLVPMQDFSKPWTDEDLYAKYKLSEDEIAFIESMIKPMDLTTTTNDGGSDE